MRGSGAGTVLPIRMFTRWTCFLLLSCFLQVSAQTSPPVKPSQTAKPVTGKKKVMLIPFEPKMFMSDIDRNINADTKMNFLQIREVFRKGLDKELARQFSPNFTIISMLRDTAKTNKDLFFIYKSIGYKYTPTKGSPPVPDPKTVSKGQIVTESQDDEEKYMRTLINQAGLFTAMNKKYGADMYVFVSELDLKGASAGGSPDREVNVHYTIYGKDGKQIYGNLGKAGFPKDMNDPKTILSKIMPLAVKSICAHAVLPAATDTGGAVKPGVK